MMKKKRSVNDQLNSFFERIQSRITKKIYSILPPNLGCLFVRLPQKCKFFKEMKKEKRKCDENLHEVVCILLSSLSHSFHGISLGESVGSHWGNIMTFCRKILGRFSGDRDLGARASVSVLRVMAKDLGDRDLGLSARVLGVIGAIYLVT